MLGRKKKDDESHLAVDLLIVEDIVRWLKMEISSIEDMDKNMAIKELYVSNLVGILCNETYKAEFFGFMKDNELFTRIQSLNLCMVAKYGKSIVDKKNIDTIDAIASITSENVEVYKTQIPYFWLLVLVQHELRLLNTKRADLGKVLGSIDAV